MFYQQDSNLCTTLLAKTRLSFCWRFFISLQIFLLGGYFLNSPNQVAAQDMVAGKTRAQWIEIVKKEGSSDNLRRAGVAALAIFGITYDDVDKTLATLLAEDKAEVVRNQVLITLANSKKADLSRWANRLADTLKNDKSPRLRQQAVFVLGRMEELAKPALSNIISACKDSVPNVRAAAVECLSKTGATAKSIIPVILPLLKDENWQVRLNSVLALGRLESLASETIPNLIQMLDTEKEASVRLEIIRDFGMIGTDSSVVPILVKIVKSDLNAENRQTAALSLGKMKKAASSSTMTLLEILQNDSDATVRTYLVRELPKISVDQLKVLVTPFANQLIKETNYNVKVAIIEELGAMGTLAIDALPALKKAQDDISVEIRNEAKLAIKKISPPKTKK